MSSYNRIILVGNLTRDPELKFTTGGTALCKFGLATNRKYKKKDGQQGEDVCFVTCVVWGRTGEIVAEHLRKGSQALIEGRLTFSTWQADDGKKHSKHEVNVDSVQFLGRPAGQQNDSPPATREQEEANGITEASSNDAEEDEVPF